MARIWKRQNVDQKFIAILLLKSENQFFVHSRKIPGDIFSLLCPKKIKSCQSPNIHFLFIISSNEDTAKKNVEKGDSFVVDIFFVQDDAEDDGDFDHLILEHSFLSSFSFCVVDSWLSFSHDRRSPSTEVSLSLTVFVGRNQDFEREESCSKFKTANKRLLEHLYLKTLFWHHE